MRNMIIFALVVVLILAILPVGLTQAQAQASICGGETQSNVNFNESGYISTHPTNALYFDTESQILWMGGTAEEGGIYAYDLQNQLWEQCARNGITLAQSAVPGGGLTTTNQIYKWGGSIFFATSGEGVLQFTPATRRAEAQWVRHSPEAEGLLSNNVYSFTTDPYSDNLLAVADNGIWKFDGVTWSKFDAMQLPGDASPITIVLPVSPLEWYFGTEGTGLYYFHSGTWDRYSSVGLQRWDPKNQIWKNAISGMKFFNTIRTLESLSTEAGILAFGNSPANALSWIYPADSANHKQLYAVVVSDDERAVIAAAEVQPDDSFVFANDSQVYGGAYHVTADGFVIQLTFEVTHDVTVVGSNVYIASESGVLLVELPK